MKISKLILPIICTIFFISLISSMSTMHSLVQIPESSYILREQIGPSELFSEDQANTYYTSNQRDTSITELNETTFVITWMSDGQDSNGYEIYARIFDNTGTAKINEFRVNNYITNAQILPSVSRLNETAFVVVWASYGQDEAGNYGVYGAIFDNLGTKLVSDFPVNNVTAGYQTYPSVSGLNDTHFVIIFAGQDADNGGIVGTIFDTTGKNVTSEFIVNSNQTGYQSSPYVDRLTDTTFAVAWDNNGLDGDGFGVYANIFDSSGTNLTNDFQVNTESSGDQGSACISHLTDTTFVISWESDGQDADGDGVFASIFNSTGARLVPEFQVNTYETSNQQSSTVTYLTDETFLIAWDSGLQDPGSSTGVYGNIFDSTGKNLTNEFRINEHTSDTQGGASACSLNDSTLAIAWSSNWQDTDQYGVYYRGFYFEDLAPESNTPSSTSYKANTTGNTIDWILTDDIGSGNYTVLLNNSEHVSWRSWDNNTNLQVPVNTTCGLGLWNYSIYFNDSNNNLGTPHTVWITINAHPPTSNSPDNATYQINTAGEIYIGWKITDEIDLSGWYRVFKNGELYKEWTTWLNNTALNVTVDTSVAGTWLYTLQYNDSIGEFGINDTVEIIITSHPPTSNSPDNATYQLNTAGEIYIGWKIIDKTDLSGWYRVFVNGELYKDWTTWLNNTALNVTVNTSAVGTWVYKLQYNDSSGEFGTNDTVEIIITPLTGSTPAPIPGFELLTVLIAISTLVCITYTLRKRQLVHLKQ